MKRRKRPKRPKRPKDPAQLAKLVVDMATGKVPNDKAALDRPKPS